ncbi:MAG: tRNA epoxyqueuosine(34) reductase QueG [Deltaproteobacteria bacterium]|nr:tRNA epoxyqueuosine(34) reductase QueG [Deltaproteobacteria bacterium]
MTSITITAAALKKIKAQAQHFGFDDCGFVFDLRPKHPDYFLQWLKDGKHASMTWLEKNTALRLDPAAIEEGMNAALVVVRNYNHHQGHKELAVARYAWGEDYHHELRRDLDAFSENLQGDLGSTFRFRRFVDTGPILERDLAEKAGLGWVGKNTCVISEELGSFVFIGVMLCNLDCNESENPVLDQCGACSLCIDSCPTQALTPYQINASRCLAYHNIEHRGERDQKYWGVLGDHLVGCDICQEVCPWNQKAPLTQRAAEFENTEFKLEDLLQLNPSQYRKQFGKTAISRIRYEDFMRNVFLLIAKQKRKDLLNAVIAWKKKNSKRVLAEWDYCVRELKR